MILTTNNIKRRYPIVCLLQFDADGEIKVLDYSGMSETELTEAIAQSKLSSLCQNVNVNDIKNAMFVLAVSKGADTVALWILCFGSITFFLVNAIRIMKKGVKRILTENILLVRVIKIFFQHIFSK